MATNFQTRQDEAHRATAILVTLFGLGIVAIIAMVTALLTAVLYSSSGELQPLSAAAIAAPLTTLGIVGASLVKSSQIKGGGGSYVATSMGGRQIDFNTLDPDDRQLANVVEELAIASGMPVPAVFVLDHEASINAFAAGWTPENAAIGVTRGALDQLTRSELQGVLAHEFSHIRNGDTRVKTRIIGWVFGIAILTVMGRILLQQLWWTPRRRDNRDNSAAMLMAAALGLIIIGAVGTLFARLIQAAISRQREYLADASAVQYTRDPYSIGGALVKIADMGNENKIRAGHATETNHLFFAPAIGAAFASHPPLDERIKRLIPDWDGTSKAQPNAGTGAVSSVMSGAGPSAGSRAMWAGGGPMGLVFPAFAGVSDAHVAHARTLIDQMPRETRDVLGSRHGAVAAIVGSLLAADPQLRAEQWRSVATRLGLDAGTIKAASTIITDLDRSLQLPAADLALRSVQGLPADYRRELAAAIGELDRPTDQDLFSWVLRRVVLRRLDDQHDQGSARHGTSLGRLRPEAATVYALLARYNSGGVTQADDAYRAALEASGDDTSLPSPVQPPTFAEVDDALVRLATIDRAGREAFVRGATAAVLRDRATSPDEAELVRVIAEAVRLPVPPLLPVTT